MGILVRFMEESDVGALVRIRNSPDLADMQYRPRRNFASNLNQIAKFQTQNEDRRSFDYLVIVSEARAIGDIAFQHGAKSSTVGWNLAVEEWGKATMPAVLDAVFCNYFAHSPKRTIVADCFSTNTRCIRVIEKLGFHSSTISWPERVLIMLRMQTLKQHLRHVLDKSSFEASQAVSESRFPVKIETDLAGFPSFMKQTKPAGQ